MNESSPAASPASRTWVDRYLPYGGVEAAAENRRSLDFATVRGILWRQRFVLIGVVALAAVVGFVATILATPIYQASTTVRVDPEQQSDIFEGESLDNPIQLNTLDGYLNTLIAVVESRAMAANVAQSLKLDQSQDFLKLTADSRPAGMSDARWAQERRELATNMVQGGVSGSVPPGQRIVQIDYRSADPQLAARIANAYADNLLVDDVRRNAQKNEYAQNYLQEQIKDVRGQLETSQRQALAYARANRIIGEALIGSSGDDDSGSTSAPATVTATMLGDINARMADARAKRIEAEQRWTTVASQPISSLPEYQTNSTVQKLTADRASVTSELSELRTRYGPQNPRILELNAQAASIDRQLNQIGSQIRSGVRQTYDIAQRQEAALSGELARISGQTLDEQDRRVAFDQLNSASQALQRQLDGLLTRYNVIASSANVRPSTMTLLDRATLPTGPVSPNLFKNMLVALLAGTGLALALAVVRETLDDRLRSGEDVERKLGLPMLGMTPLVDKHTEVNESLALSEAYASIRAALDFALPTREHAVMALTSSQSREGKTTTATALAQEYAKLGRRTLLVDGDLRRPSVGKTFGVKRTDKGFPEVLAGTSALRDALLPPMHANLDVLPIGPIPTNPVEIVSSPRTAEFFEHVRGLYDIVVIDCPPVMGLADAPLLARYADGAIFVVESNRAHFGAAKAALRRLQDGGNVVLGVVLSKFRALEAGYNYDYQYAYYAYGSKKV